MSNKHLNIQDGRMERDDTVEIDLVAFCGVIKKKILVVLLLAVLGGAIAGAYSFFVATPMYESTSKIYILSQSTSITSLADVQLGTELAKDYTEMIYSYPVVKEVTSNLGLDYTYKEASKMLTIVNPENTRVIKITVTSDNPQEAADMANEFANVSKQSIAHIMETDEPKLFERGRVSENPVSPEKTKNIAIGFLCGGFLAILIILILFVTRDTIRTPEDIQRRLGGNVLAAVPMEKTTKARQYGSRKGGRK